MGVVECYEGQGKMDLNEINLVREWRSPSKIVEVFTPNLNKMLTNQDWLITDAGEAINCTNTIQEDFVEQS